MKGREAARLHEGDDSVLRGRFRHDVEIQRHTRMTIGGQGNAADHRPTKAVSAKDVLQGAQFGGEIHSSIVAYGDKSQNSVALSSFSEDGPLNTRVPGPPVLDVPLLRNSGSSASGVLRDQLQRALVPGAVEVAIAGTRESREFRALEHEVAVRYVPSLVLAGGESDSNGLIALMKDRRSTAGHATAYVCRSYTCEAPTTDPTVLAKQLEHAGRSDKTTT